MKSMIQAAMIRECGAYPWWPKGENDLTKEPNKYVADQTMIERAKTYKPFV